MQVVFLIILVMCNLSMVRRWPREASLSMKEWKGMWPLNHRRLYMVLNGLMSWISSHAESIGKIWLKISLLLFNHRQFNSVDNIKKITNEITNCLFFRLYVILTEGYTNKIKWVNIFVWRAFSVFKFIVDYITNGITDRSRITEKSFFNEQ